MRGKNTVIALIIFALLGAYWYFVEVKKKKTDEDKKAESERLFPGMKDADISKLEFRSAEGVITAVKQPGGWKIQKPAEYDGDDNSLNSIVTAFVQLKISRKLDSGAAADYNLNTSGAYCSVSAFGKEHLIYFGAENPTGNFVYAMLQGDGTVYLVDNALEKDISKKLFDLRFKGLFKTAEPEANRIEVDLKGKKYTLEKISGSWKITAPVRDDAKKESVLSIIGYMNNGSVKSFVPASKTAAYGLSESVESITVYSSGSTNTAYFGKLDAKKNSVFAKSTAGSDVMELPDYIYKNIPVFEAVINKQLVLIDEDNISSAVMSYAGKTIEAKRGADRSWSTVKKIGVNEDKKYPLNPGAVLSSLRWTEYKYKYPKGEGIDAAKFFTDERNALKIELKGKDGKTIGTLVFSNLTDNGLLYVKVPQRDTIYAITPGTVLDWHLPGLEIK